MKTLQFAGAAALALAGTLLGLGRAADPKPAAAPAPLVVHEWGTFTSFAGSDGAPATFTPNYTDLPDFVYTQNNVPNTKTLRLLDGTVSMETPVLYFYSDQAMKVSVKVGFPKGWITEWYPFATVPPNPGRPAGSAMQWDVRLLPGEAVKLPGKPSAADHYYRARETDAVPLQAEVQPREGEQAVRGGTLVQREKFLFYRGVGTFPPPVTLKSLGGGQVKIAATGDCSVDGLVLVHVRGGKIGFQSLGNLAAGGEVKASIPAADGGVLALAGAIEKQLVAAGLFEKEARAMVNTWTAAWFGEEGTRLLYLVPRTRTDELLPLSISPKPEALVRVLVGRHDFLTPEQEATAEKEMKRLKAAQAEVNAAEAELKKIGRFHPQAREQAARRLAGPKR